MLRTICLILVVLLVNGCESVPTAQAETVKTERNA
jgi:uncharacterized protein YceK